jgi:hypothetical protein
MDKFTQKAIGDKMTLMSLGISTICFFIARFIPKSLQLQKLVKLARLG